MAVYLNRWASFLWIVALCGVRLFRVFFAFEAGRVRCSIEEPVKGLGQLLQRILQSGRVGRPQPRERLLQRGQPLGTLFAAKPRPCCFIRLIIYDSKVRERLGV